MVSIFAGSPSLTRLVFDLAVASDLVVFFPVPEGLKTALVKPSQFQELPEEIRTGKEDITGDPGSTPIVCSSVDEFAATIELPYGAWEQWVRRDYPSGPIVISASETPKGMRARLGRSSGGMERPWASNALYEGTAAGRRLVCVAAGSSTWKVEPSPSLDSTQIRPSKRRTSSREM